MMSMDAAEVLGSTPPADSMLKERAQVCRDKNDGTLKTDVKRKARTGMLEEWRRR